MTGARTRIRLHAVVHEPQPETPLERARKRYGKTFGHESGSTFKWSSGPTVLRDWLAKRVAGKAHG
jgi:hypothetical protein